MDPGDLARIAEERFTAQRVHVVDTLPDAVSAALDLVGVPDPTADDDVDGDAGGRGAVPHAAPAPKPYSSGSVVNSSG